MVNELLFNSKKNNQQESLSHQSMPLQYPEALPLFHRLLNNLLKHTTSWKKTNPHEKHYSIMGDDWNTSIGTKNSENKNRKVLGKYGISNVNGAGKKQLELMHKNKLRALHTYFKMKKNQKFSTFFDNLHEQRPLILDFFLTKQKL
jgi:hypothetical protein